MRRLTLTQVDTICARIQRDGTSEERGHMALLNKLREHAVSRGLAYVDLHGMVNPTAPFPRCISTYCRKCGIEHEQ